MKATSLPPHGEAWRREIERVRSPAFAKEHNDPMPMHRSGLRRPIIGINKVAVPTATLHARDTHATALTPLPGWICPESSGQIIC